MDLLDKPDNPDRPERLDNQAKPARGANEESKAVGESGAKRALPVSLAAPGPRALQELAARPGREDSRANRAVEGRLGLPVLPVGHGVVF